MPPVRTFVILYSSREGSTPLIDLLSRHPSVFVAGFEHLDRHNLARHVDHPERRIGEILDRALTTGVVPGQGPKQYAGEPVIGLKWRPHGGRSAVAALRRNRCLVVFLHRRDALARALSMVLNPEHLQFTIAEMAPSERAEALARSRTERFRADPSVVASNISMYLEGKARIWNTYCGRGLETQSLDYERFADEPQAAINGILSALGVEPFLELPRGRFFKTTSDDIASQCENIREVQSSQAVRTALASYEQLLRQIDSGRQRVPGGWQRLNALRRGVTRLR